MVSPDHEIGGQKNRAEGWYEDPYRVHEARWFSMGTATKLVRDGDIESSDPPPPNAVPGPLVRISSRNEAVAGEFLRADDAERSSSDEKATRRILDIFDQFGHVN